MELLTGSSLNDAPTQRFPYATNIPSDRLLRAAQTNLAFRPADPVGLFLRKPSSAIPVYLSGEETLESAAATPESWLLILVEDGWPDFLLSPRLAKFLRARDDFEASSDPFARGGFGNAFYSIEKATGREFVEKRIFYNPGDRKRRLREMDIQCSVKHPAVAGLHALVIDENGISLFTEYYANKSIDIYTKKTPLTNTQKMIIIAGIAEGMRFLHSKKIVHRDIKPENVLLDGELRPRICDFGMSTIVSSSNSVMRTTGGTPGYEAPELLSPDEDNGYRKPVDYFAYGMLVYAVCTGKTPAEGLRRNTPITLFAISRAIVSGQRPAIDVPLPKCVENLITGLWQTNPLARPTFSMVVEQFVNKTVMLNDVDISAFDAYMHALLHRKCSVVWNGLRVDKDLQTHLTVKQVELEMESHPQFTRCGPFDLECDGEILPETMQVHDFPDSAVLIVRERPARETVADARDRAALKYQVPPDMLHFYQGDSLVHDNAILSPTIVTKVRVPVELANGRRYDVIVNPDASVGDLIDALNRDYGLGADCVLLSGDRRLEAADSLAGLAFPLLLRATLFVQFQVIRTGRVLERPFVEGDTIGTARDALAQEFKTVVTDILLLVDGHRIDPALPLAEIRGRLIGFELMNPDTFEVVLDIEGNLIQWNCVKGQTFGELRTQFAVDFAVQLRPFAIVVDDSPIADDQLIEAHQGRRIRIMFPATSYTFRYEGRRAQVDYCPLFRIGQIRGRGSFIDGLDIDAAQYFVGERELGDEVMLAELNPAEIIDVRIEDKLIAIWPDRATQAPLLRGHFPIFKRVIDLKRTCIEGVRNAPNLKQIYLTDRLSDCPLPNLMRISDLPEELQFNYKRAGGYRVIIIVDGEPVAYPMTPGTTAAQARRDLELVSLSVPDHTVLFDLDDDVDLTGRRDPACHVKFVVHDSLSCIMSVPVRGEVMCVSLAKSILSISFLKVPREWLVITRDGRDIADQEPLRPGAEFSVSLRRRDRTEYKVVGCGFSCTLGFGIFDTVAQAAATIGQTLDVEVERLSYLGAAMEAHRPLSYYRIRRHIGVVRFTGKAPEPAARGPVVIDQIVEFDGKQYLVRMDEEFEFGKLKMKLGSQIHVPAHEIMLTSDSGEVQDWETPKSVGRPAVIKIGVRSLGLSVPPPAQPAAGGTEYQFNTRDGRPVARLQFDADDTFGTASQQISDLTGWRNVKCFLPTGSGLSEIDADATFDDMADLLDESGNTLIAEEGR
jgi:hypothetical protein